MIDILDFFGARALGFDSSDCKYVAVALLRQAGYEKLMRSTVPVRR